MSYSIQSIAKALCAGVCALVLASCGVSKVVIEGSYPTPNVAKLPLTLAQRIDILYGRKPPEPEATPAEVAPAATSIAPAAAPAATPATTATAPAVTPAPDATKVEEKGKDLDRKMNQLFK